MADDLNARFTQNHGHALERYWERIKTEIAAWMDDYEWPPGKRAQAAISIRNMVAEQVRREVDRDGFLSKDTFESVMKWGFGFQSRCSTDEIEDATRRAFRHLRENRIAEAAKSLVELPGIGISRATKVLALSNQNDLGIYDSHSAHGLSDLKDASGRRIIAIPPGRVITGDLKTPSEFCTAFQEYTWALRYFRRLAAKDDTLRTRFARIADIEIAFFARSRSGGIPHPKAPPKPPANLQEPAGHDEESLFWTLAPGEKAKSFLADITKSSVTVFTGSQYATISKRSANQMNDCLAHFSEHDWFPLSNSKTAKDRDENGLGAYFFRNFGSPVFASHFAALWVHFGNMEARIDARRILLKVRKSKW